MFKGIPHPLRDVGTNRKAEYATLSRPRLSLTSDRSFQIYLYSWSLMTPGRTPSRDISLPKHKSLLLSLAGVSLPTRLNTVLIQGRMLITHNLLHNCTESSRICRFLNKRVIPGPRRQRRRASCNLTAPPAVMPAGSSCSARVNEQPASLFCTYQQYTR